MQALVLGAEGPAVEEREPPRPDDEAVIRLSVGGVCATDLELCRGYMGFRGVLGHEFVGVVEASPDPRWIGRRVVGEINAACGRCATCRAGRPTHCPRRTVLGIQGRDGAFAERFTLPVRNLHAVPDGVMDEAAVFVEPLAAALRILDQVHVRPTDRVVVLGLGRLGQLCARVLALTGAQVTGVARSAAKRALLPAGIDAVAANDADGLPPADLVVDTTGAASGLALATARVRPGGTLVLKTTVHEAEAVQPTGWVIDEITVVGSRCGPFAPALRLLASGAVDPTPLITARYALADGLDALERAGEPGSLKVLLRP
ncbi:MAG: alcohol dehydrogenase catalytic domain-containing protein [Alphaproteobacteria bacterium]|nr:alcohol dehydrogenase catalytic domain-containing protein [Alphaproteobacteria bacterium]